ncbi:MAG: transporter substrate-binding domain-containing protein [Oceanospirillaceae bacterium]
MRLKFIAIFFILSLPLPANADKMLWYVLDYKPYEYVEDGVFKGYGVKWMKMLQSELPQYQHSFNLVNYSRLFRSLANGDQACSLGFYPSKNRDSIVHYSIPDVLWFPLQLFMRKSTYQALGEPKSLSISDILTNKLGTIGITNGYSYSRPIDKILAQHKGNTRIFVNYTGIVSKNLFSMMNFNRIDFLLEFPPEGTFAAKEINAAKNIISVPIEEAAQLSFSHTVCTKTPWGEKAIDDINKALVKLRKTEKWRAVYEDVIDLSLVELYRARYKEILLPIIE